MSAQDDDRRDDARTAWPDIPYDTWRDTALTLRLMTQIVGKVRLRRAPLLNHSWSATLYVTPRGLTTGPLFHDQRMFEIRFDFLAQQLIVEASDGGRWSLALEPRPVSRFYAAVMVGLDGLGLATTISRKPNEIEDAIRFDEDDVHCAYDGEAAQRFWRALTLIERPLQQFRSEFIGKCSPAHFFWGSFDLAATRFSGRRAPPHPGGVPNLPLDIPRDAYSHEVSSAGFWPGGGGLDYPAFYSYAYPAPAGFADAPIEPDGAFFSATLQEFILPYDIVRRAPSPEAHLTRFLQSSYDTAASLGGWDRAALERPPAAATAQKVRRERIG